MKQVIIIKEETTEMSEKYAQLLKALKKSEISDVIDALESNVTLDDDYKSPNVHAKKEVLVEAALSLISENEFTDEWKTIVKEIPYLNDLEDSEDAEEEEEIEEAAGCKCAEDSEAGCKCGDSEAGCQCAETNEAGCNCAEDPEAGCKCDDSEDGCKCDDSEAGCKCDGDAEGCECQDCDCEDCVDDAVCEDSCCFSYEPTLHEKIQWKIYDFRWFLLLQDEALKNFCTSAEGLFKITTSVELVALFTYVYQNMNTLVYSPEVTSRISNPNALLALKFLEILGGYVSIFVFVPFVASYYFNFLPEPIVEEDDDDELYASDSDEYDEYESSSDEGEDEDEDLEEVEEIEEEASQEGEDLNDALVEGDDYDYEDLDEEYLEDSDIEDDFDYEEYPNLTLVDEPEKDKYDPFTFSLAKIAVAYICLRYGVGLCEFNNLVVLSKLCEIVIGFGIVGALIGLYN